jgi:hypothetical protein
MIMRSTRNDEPPYHDLRANEISQREDATCT